MQKKFAPRTHPGAETVGRFATQIAPCVAVRRRHIGPHDPCFTEGDPYELLVGERRVRAVKLLEWDTIRAEIRTVSDPIARGIVLSENLKRDDLTAIEQILADALWIDNELCQDSEYTTLQIPEKVRTQWTAQVKTLSPEYQQAIVRLNYLLMKLYSDEKHHTNYFGDKFIPKVEAAFQSLIEPVEWQSFYQHDLTSYLKMDEEVKQIAVKKKLNKSQAKALNSLKKESQTAFQEVKETGMLKVENAHYHQEPVDIQEVSSRARAASPTLC